MNRHKFRLMRPHSKLAGQLPGEYPESVNTALARYLLLVSTPPQFTESEWNLMRDACNRWATSMEPPETLKGGLILQISDAMCDSQLGSKWRVSRPELMMKLESLTTAEAIATIHAIECFWEQA